MELEMLLPILSDCGLSVRKPSSTSLLRRGQPLEAQQPPLGRALEAQAERHSIVGKIMGTQGLTRGPASPSFGQT